MYGIVGESYMVRCFVGNFYMFIFISKLDRMFIYYIVCMNSCKVDFIMFMFVCNVVVFKYVVSF